MKYILEENEKKDYEEFLKHKKEIASRNAVMGLVFNILAKECNFCPNVGCNQYGTNAPLAGEIGTISGRRIVVL